MNKKWMLGSLALSLGLLSAGSGVMAASSSVGSSAIKNVAVIGTGKEGPATINNLTVKSVVPLVVHARAIYFYTSRGATFSRWKPSCIKRKSTVTFPMILGQRRS